MPRDYTTVPPHQVRRRDRAVEDDAWIRAMLHRAPLGTLATVHDGQPFINSNLFVYDEEEHCIYMHTARVGRTQANVDRAQAVCFNVSEMGRLLPAEEALHFSVEYAGVTVFGTATIIREPKEAGEALQRLLDKYAPHLKPGRDYRPIVAEELERTAVYRIAIEAWSGKKKEVEPDFPGAYRYEDHQPTIRRATADDATLLADLGARTFYDAFARDNKPDDIDRYLARTFTVDQMTRELADPHAMFLLIQIQDETVGYAKLKTGEPPACVDGSRPIEVERIYVDQRVTSRGLGGALMRACLDAARQAGRGVVWLGVWERNTRAQSFYRTWGFRTAGTKTFTIGDDVQTDVVMTRLVESG